MTKYQTPDYRPASVKQWECEKRAHLRRFYVGTGLEPVVKETIEERLEILHKHPMSLVLLKQSSLWRKQLERQRP